jgi:nucleoside-diphosphate-sugar epimerase
VVITSSIAAICHGHDPKYPVYNETHWSDLEFLQEKGLEYLGGYCLSKTLAEKAAWDYQKELPEAERFEIVCINPCLVVGPAFVGSGF